MKYRGHGKIINSVFHIIMNDNTWARAHFFMDGWGWRQSSTNKSIYDRELKSMGCDRPFDELSETARNFIVARIDAARNLEQASRRAHPITRFNSINVRCLG